MLPSEVSWCRDLKKKHSIDIYENVELYWFQAKVLQSFTDQFDPKFQLAKQVLSDVEAKRVLKYNFGNDTPRDYEGQLPSGKYLLVGYDGDELKKYIQKVRFGDCQKIKKAPYSIRVTNAANDVIHNVNKDQAIGVELQQFLNDREYEFGMMRAAFLRGGVFHVTEMVEEFKTA